MDELTLTGDGNTPDMPLTDAQVNHLRRLLAWMRLEYCLDENMQRGCLQAVQMLYDNSAITPSQAAEHLQHRAEQINHVPAYLRQGVKMLTKALHDHDRRAGIVEGPEAGRDEGDSHG